MATSHRHVHRVDLPDLGADICMRPPRMCPWPYACQELAAVKQHLFWLVWNIAFSLTSHCKAAIQSVINDSVVVRRSNTLLLVSVGVCGESFGLRLGSGSRGLSPGAGQIGVNTTKRASPTSTLAGLNHLHGSRSF